MNKQLAASLLIGASSVLLSGCLSDLLEYDEGDPYDISTYNEKSQLNQDFEGAWILVSKDLKRYPQQTRIIHTRRVCSFEKIDTSQYSSTCFKDQVDALFTLNSNQLVNSNGTVTIDTSTFTRASGSVNASISDNEIIQYPFEMKKIGALGSAIGTQSLNQDIANTVEFRQEYDTEDHDNNELVFIDENTNIIDLTDAVVLASSVSGTYDPREIDGVGEHGYRGKMGSKILYFDYFIVIKTGNDVNGTVDIKLP